MHCAVTIEDKSLRKKGDWSRRAERGLLGLKEISEIVVRKTNLKNNPRQSRREKERRKVSP